MKTLTLEAIRDIRSLTKASEKQYLTFIYELEQLLKTQNSGPWFKKPLDEKGITVGEVWEQSLGKIKYRKTVHTFAYMYVPHQGLAIKKHGHNTFVHNNRNVKKTKELYVFYIPSSLVEMKFCYKDEMHELCNNYGEPVYVISAKVTGRY